MKELEELLKRHDWTFEYSDDHSVWKRGLNHYKAMCSEYEKQEKVHGEEKCKELWNKYAISNRFKK